MTKDEVVERILALKAITRATGVKTTRTQGELLESLSGPLLAEVALDLARAEQLAPLFGYDKKREENARTTAGPTTLRKA